MPTTTVSVADLTALAYHALTRAGLSHSDADVTARILIQADMMGVPTHGVVRLRPYTDRLRNGAVDPEAQPTVDWRAPALALVDGHNALGPVVGQAALEAALATVAETGIAHVGCFSSNHFGALLPYALQACEAGYVFVAGTSASPTMPPFGGAEVRIGNNPLCIAAPCPEAPHFILDMAMSVAARGKIRQARAEGKPIPEGWALDAEGKPTTDPAAALAGFLVAVGGHKGSGLSLAVDILAGAINGAGFLTGVSSWVDAPDKPQGLGHFFQVIDAARLIGKDRFEAAMRDFRDTVHATAAADPAQPVILPGEREQRAMETARADGIDVDDAVLADVRSLAGE